MPSAPSRRRKPATRRKASVASAVPDTSEPDTHIVWRRTRLLVEALLETMEQGIRNPGHQPEEHWQRIFGNKDSAVVNLQKLVQVLGELQAHAAPPARDSQEQEPMPEAEIALLRGWLEQINGSSDAVTPAP